LGALHELFDHYGDRVAFFVIYIREAHPEDGWVITPNRDEDIRVQDPTSEVQRVEVAQTCAVHGSIRIPVLLDGLDDRVARLYGGWPDRLYLIDRQGKIAFQGAEGPFGFKPELLETAIQRELALSG